MDERDQLKDEDRLGRLKYREQIQVVGQNNIKKLWVKGKRLLSID